MAETSDVSTSEAEVWRVRFAVKKGAGSWGDTKFFENPADLEGWLINAMINAEAVDGRPSRRSVREWWWAKTEPKVKANEIESVYRIIAIEHMEGGKWVEKKATLHAPWVELI